MEYTVVFHEAITVKVNPENYATKEDLKAAIIHEAEIKAGRGFNGEAHIVEDPTFLGE